MKKILGIIAIAGITASCRDKAESISSISAADSTRIYEEQKAKEQKQVAPATVVYKNENSNAAQTTEKKGWSSAAKGTVIGAGAGAVTGAVVSKKKGKGAVIGGILGAGAGYVIGRSKDRKTGRVQKQ